jgi:hypothetical protein
MDIEDGMTPEQRAMQEHLEKTARKIASLFDSALNPNRPLKREVGFAVLLFGFGDPPQPATWISNAERGDLIRAVEEWLERAKART